MPQGRSTFSKRQKEQARQQKQRDKAERRNQRKLEKQEGGGDGSSDLMDASGMLLGPLDLEPYESGAGTSAGPSLEKPQAAHGSSTTMTPAAPALGENPGTPRKPQ
jgi:hypothetical protein